MDSAIVEWLNSLGGHVPVFDRFMSVMVSDYFTPVVGSCVLLALWFLGRDGVARYKNQLTTFTGVVALALANAQIAIVNLFYFRTRPYVNLNLKLHFYRPTDSSFPANSAAVGFAVATAVYMHNRPLGIALYGLALMWGIARMYAGVHYPTDILGGATIGVVGALLAAYIVRKLEFIPRRVIQVLRLFYIA